MNTPTDKVEKPNAVISHIKRNKGKYLAGAMGISLGTKLHLAGVFDKTPSLTSDELKEKAYQKEHPNEKLTDMFSRQNSDNKQRNVERFNMH